MFDWDQLQRSWFPYDLVSSIWTVVTLERAGSPIDQSKVPQANSELYTTWLLEGYESDGEGGAVDRAALQRILMIRRELYRRFCGRVVLELPTDHPMAGFASSWLIFSTRKTKKRRHNQLHLTLISKT